MPACSIHKRITTADFRKPLARAVRRNPHFQHRKPTRTHHTGQNRLMDVGEIVEENTPELFFNHPQTDRAQLFLNQIL